MITMRRTPELIRRRIRQTPTAFSNPGSVFGHLLLSRGPFARPDITFDVRSNGYKVITPNAPGARHPVYEIFAEDAYAMDELLAGLPAAPVVLDIGAQIGAFSLALASASPSAKVFSYEASPFTAGYLQANVDRNGLSDRVKVHATALASAEGEFTFMDSQSGSGLNGLTAPEGMGVEVTVPATTFDAAVAAAGGHVDLVKMDVEGAEYDIILPSSPASWASVQKVVMEYHPLAGHSLAQLEEFFAGVGLVRSHHETVREGLGALWLTRNS